MRGNLPKGDKYLPNTSIEDLKKKHKEEKNPKVKERLLMCIRRKYGDSLRAIGKIFCKSHNCARNWLIRAEGGLDKLHDKKRPGAKRKLTNEQLAQIKEDLLKGPQAHGFESNMWTGRLVAEHILRKYNIEYTPRNMQNLLRKMGYRHVKPRPRHPKAASKEEMAEFKEDTGQKVIDHHKQGYTILSGDEASFILGWNLQRGWYHQDSPAIAPVTLSRERFHCIGVLGVNTMYYRFYEKANTASFIDFLKHVYEEYGKFVIFLDNAAIHKSKALKKFLEEMNEQIKVYYFPTYTPELNPTELMWRSFRKATGNRLYESTEAMQESITKMTGNEIRVVKTYAYLTC